MSFENGDLLLVEKPAHCTVPVSPPITDTLSKLTHVPLYPFPFKPFLGKGYLTAFKNLWSYLGLEGKKCQTFFQELNWLFELLHQETVTAIFGNYFRCKNKL